MFIRLLQILEFRPHHSRQCCSSWLLQAVVQHAFPCNASIPSLAMIGVMIRAASGSDHHHPVAAFKIKPTNKMAERYVQKSACLASANIAALPSCSPTRFFAWERRGIATKAAQATTIPAMLCAGACLRHRLEIATEATYRESTRKQIPTILRVNRSFCSRLSSPAISDKRHSKATAEVTSIKLSTPKPTREILPEMNPVANAANPSRLFHPIVKYSRRLPR